MISDDARLPYHHARTVVYGEVFTYGGTGIDVDAGDGMSKLRDDAGNDRNTQFQQDMCRP